MRACLTVAVDQSALLMLLLVAGVGVLSHVHASGSMLGHTGYVCSSAGLQADRWS